MKPPRQSRSAELPYLARPVTLAAPHVRRGGDLAGVMGSVLVALLPCLVFGLYNAGYQANRVLAQLGVELPPGRRGALLRSLGAGFDSNSVRDCLLHGAAYFVPLLVVCALTGLACERAFARLRRLRPSPGLAVTVTLFCLCLPPTLPLWQAALGLAFGLILGREVFGGTGRNFLNPALVGLAFLYFAYPSALKGPGLWTAVDGYSGATALSTASLGGMQALEAGSVSWLATFLGRVPGAFGETSTLACLVGGGYLLARRLISWRILVGATLGLVATVLLLQLAEGPAPPASHVPWTWHLTLGGFAFGVIFMATDPVTSAGTNAGRWIYGLLIGFLVVVIRVQSPVHPEGVLLAILLGNVFAPLIDHAVVQRDIRRRRLRHG
jgi:Na+-transporting NADH:ubiquinone oxidoreductase subunit B